jgi:hypothetical protein
VIPFKKLPADGQGAFSVADEFLTGGAFTSAADSYRNEEYRDAAVYGTLGILQIFPAAATDGESAAVGRFAVTFSKKIAINDRLLRAGLNVDATKAAVAAEIEAMGANVSGHFAGRFTVDGVLVEYRGFLLSDDLINIGTIFPVK